MRCIAVLTVFQTDTPLTLITGNALQPFQNIGTSSLLLAPALSSLDLRMRAISLILWEDACHWAGVMWQSDAWVFHSLLQNSIKVKGCLIKCQTVVLWKHQWWHSVTIYAPPTHAYTEWGVQSRGESEGGRREKSNKQKERGGGDWSCNILPENADILPSIGWITACKCFMFYILL